MGIIPKQTIIKYNGELISAKDIEIGDIVISKKYTYSVITNIYATKEQIIRVFLDTGERVIVGYTSKILTPDGFEDVKKAKSVLYHEPPHFYFNSLYRKPKYFEVGISDIEFGASLILYKIYPDFYLNGIIVRG